MNGWLYDIPETSPNQELKSRLPEWSEQGSVGKSIQKDFCQDEGRKEDKVRSAKPV